MPAQAGISLFITPAASQTFLVSQLALAFQPAALRGLGWFGCNAFFGWGCGTLQQSRQALQRIGTITFLGTKPLCTDYQHTFTTDTVASQIVQSLLQRIRQRCVTGNIEPQLRSCCNLVYILSARTGSAYKTKLNIVFVQDDTGSDSQSGHLKQHGFLLGYIAKVDPIFLAIHHPLDLPVEMIILCRWSSKI